MYPGVWAPANLIKVSSYQRVLKRLQGRDGWPNNPLSSMPRTLDTLAVELLTMISFYACTDGGQTGCSLSLVSKRIRAASRPARFYSVLLLGSPSQIERFLLAYQAECSRAPDALPRVRHLCLSLIGKGVDTPGTSPTPARLATHPKSRAEFIAAMQRRTQLWRTGQESLDEQYNRVVPALMGALATDLHTLSLIQGQWRRGTSIPCYFPSLRELTVVGGDSSFFPFASVPRDRPLYPALERLHHIFAWSNKDVDYRQWAPHAPNVTHLRATRIDCHPRITVDTFQQVVSEYNFPF